MAKYVFGEDEQVYRAIFYHTTGRADMSLLEKLIYLADYIEPTRDFDGVNELRRLAYEDLDRALVMGMNMTIEEMADIFNIILSEHTCLKPHSTNCSPEDCMYYYLCKTPVGSAAEWLKLGDA